MSALSNVLEDFLRESGTNQTVFAQEHDLDRGTVNRTIRGRSIGPEAASRIIHAMPPEWQGRGIAGWLQDQAPADLRGLFTIIPEGNRLQEAMEETPDLPSDLSRELRKAIVWLADQAIIHVEIRDLVMTLFRTLARPGQGLRETKLAFSSRAGSRNTVPRSERVESALRKLREMALRDDVALAVLEDQVASLPEPGPE